MKNLWAAVRQTDRHGKRGCWTLNPEPEDVLARPFTCLGASGSASFKGDSVFQGSVEVNNKMEAREAVDGECSDRRLLPGNMHSPRAAARLCFAANITTSFAEGTYNLYLVTVETETAGFKSPTSPLKEEFALQNTQTLVLPPSLSSIPFPLFLPPFLPHVLRCSDCLSGTALGAVSAAVNADRCGVLPSRSLQSSTSKFLQAISVEYPW